MTEPVLPADTDRVTINWRECSLCHVPIASSACRHVERLGERIIMSAEMHEELVAELARLRALEAEQSDGRADGA